jgi:hypothetical protein
MIPEQAIDHSCWSSALAPDIAGEKETAISYAPRGEGVGVRLSTFDLGMTGVAL